MRRWLRLMSVLGVFCLLQPTAGAQARPSIANRVVVLQGLDKITARTSSFEAPIDGVTRFGSLAITPKACFSSTPTEPPESAAFLQIDEVAASEEQKRVFAGWMFSSSPALSALENPIYDVWVLTCSKPVDPEASSPTDVLPEAPATTPDTPPDTPSTTQAPNG